eukprot:gene29144-38208_t
MLRSCFMQKLLLSGFFTDAYDLFCISLLTKLLGRIYYQDNPFTIQNTVDPCRLPIEVDAAVSAVRGQVLFGYLGDVLGRKTVYGVVLVIMVFCAFAQSMSFGTSANAVVGTLCFWRFILGEWEEIIHYAQQSCRSIVPNCPVEP